MKPIAFLFPGQGSQSVGMHKDYAEASPANAEFLAKADQILGSPLSTLFLSGEEEELKKTENTQPALYITGALSHNLLVQAGIAPTHVAGHSLGEYTALYAAGSFDFATGLKLVQARGKAFAEAGKIQAGAMAAILGMESAAVLALCQAVQKESGQIVVPANYNDPGQTVISGDPEGVRLACERAKAEGAKRALPLPVSGAFHSPLVKSAGAVMEAELAKSAVSSPKCRFINNADCAFLTQADAIRSSLVRQVTSSVRWVECVRALAAEGVETFVEVGPGKVLAGLVKRIEPNARILTTETYAKLQETISTLQNEGFAKP